MDMAFKILLSAFMALLGVIGYFMKRHMETVESDVKKLRSEVVALKQDSIWIVNAMKELRASSSRQSQEVQAVIIKLQAKLDEVKDSTSHLEDKIKTNEKHLENYGQVIRMLTSKK